MSVEYTEKDKVLKFAKEYILVSEEAGHENLGEQAPMGPMILGREIH